MENNNIIGLGTAAIGRPTYINIKDEAVVDDFSLEAFRQKGKNMLEEAYKNGIRYFDTAPGYGMAEDLLIDWVLQKKDPSIKVATKWGYTYVANFNPNAIHHEIKEHSLEKLKEQWAKSKSLLPFLKNYQIHSATLESGVLKNEAVLNQLAYLKNEYNLSIGITTSGANQVEVLKKALDVEVEGMELFNFYQVTYNVFEQSLASIAVEMSKRDKRLVIKEAMANGRVFPNEKYLNYTAAYKILDDLAQKYNVGVDAISLRFCMDSIPADKVLSGAANEHHLFGNLKAANFKLKEEDVVMLKDLAIDPAYYWNERKLLEWK